MEIAEMREIADAESRARCAHAAVVRGREAALVRQEAVRELHAAGWTYQRIAGLFGVSKARVQQMVTGQK